MAKAKVIQSGQACTILIEGNPKKRPEPSENIIKFPGGSISVARTSDNEYWAHIEVNHDQVVDDIHRQSKRGDVVDSRLDYSYGVMDINDIEYLNHIAVRIKTS